MCRGCRRVAVVRTGPFRETVEPADWIGDGCGQCIPSRVHRSLVELIHKGRCSDVGCHVAPVLFAAVVDAVMRLWRQECLRNRIEHGGNVDDEFLSNGENREYDVIKIRTTMWSWVHMAHSQGLGDESLTVDESVVWALMKIKMRNKKQRVYSLATHLPNNWPPEYGMLRYLATVEELQS